MLLGSLLTLIAFGSILVAISKLTTTTGTPAAKAVSLSQPNNNNRVDNSPFQRYTKDAPTSCNDPIDANDVQFTLVSQLSFDRIWMLEHHCKRWQHYMSVAVWTTTNQTQSDVMQHALQLGCDSTLLTLQVLSSHEYPEYPVNVLRNMALSTVHTSHILHVDVDFWESTDLYSLLESTKQALAQNHKMAIVIPAFQLNRQCREWKECPEQNIPKMPHSVQDILKLIRGKNGAPFDPTNHGGHGSTLYSAWIKQTPGTLLQIPCITSNRYEPYIAVRYCRELPPFQPAFTGYGKNKMTMIMHMRKVGYTFFQLGGAYVVHYPHLDSPSRMNWNNGGARAEIDALFVTFRQWLQQEITDSSITQVPKCQDAEDDDAKLRIHRSKPNI